MMSVTRKYFLIMIFLLPFVLEVGCSEKKGKQDGAPDVGQKPSVEDGVEVGRRAPDFKIKNLKGGLTTLFQHRGKVVMINFWATWCGPCRAEMPSMETLYQSYRRDDFEILAVSIDTLGEPPVRAYVNDLGLSFPILLDTEYTLNDYYQVRVAPTSFLVDRQGVIVQKVMGARDWNSPGMRAMVEKLIEVKKS